MYLKPPSALAAGFFADRAGISRAVSLCFLILIGGFAVFILTPGSPRLVAILIANTAITSLAIFALRGIYFALLEEGGVPLAVTGTATGIVSVVGFTPDVFMPMVGGVLLDRYPGAPGYRLLFLFIAVLCLGGLFSAIIIQRKYARRKLRISQNLT
jgi:MFS family permease